VFSVFFPYLISCCIVVVYFLHCEFLTIEFSHDDYGEDTVVNAVRATSIARATRKKADKVAKEALELARRELKWKGKLINLWSETRKKTMNSYFQSTGGARAG